MSKSPLRPRTAKQLHGVVAASIEQLKGFERNGRIVSVLVSNLFEALENRHLLRAAVGADEVARATFVRAKLELADKGLSPETAESLGRVLGPFLRQVEAEAYPDGSDSWRLYGNLKRRRQAVWNAAWEEYYRDSWGRR